MLLKSIENSGMLVEMRADGFSDEMFSVRCGRLQRKFADYVEADIFFESCVDNTHLQ